jgi:hypothetical protein
MDMPSDDSARLYETKWGYAPLIGSFNQMMFGRTPLKSLCGTVWFAIDCSMALPVLRGMYFGFTTAAAAGLQLVRNRGGTMVQQAAMAQFVNQGGKFMIKEAAEHAAMQ